ncbi:MAG: metalloregulator ArsR/SmtB family transcription factor [Dehalococcoidia bacterium]
MRTLAPDPLLPVLPEEGCEPAPPISVRPGLVRQLKALGDETRLQLLGQIAGQESICVCNLTAGATVGQPTVSHHLKVLRDAGIVDCVRRGTWAYYFLQPDLPPVVRAAIAELTGR